MGWDGMGWESLEIYLVAFHGGVWTRVGRNVLLIVDMALRFSIVVVSLFV